MTFAVLSDLVLRSRDGWAASDVLVTLLLVAVAFAAHSLDARRRLRRLLDRHDVERRAAAARINRSLSEAAAVAGMLSQSEARYKGLVDAQGDAIFRRDAQGHVTYANDAFLRLFSDSPEQAFGKPFVPQLHPEIAAPFFGTLTGQEMGRTRVRYDQHIKTAFGWRWFAWEDYILRDKEGQFVEVQSVGRDVTERKELEDALMAARDKAESGSRAKSGFLASMSHEIRTPMNGVLGMARLLQDTELAPEQRTYVEAIRSSGETLLALIGDLLDFSKIESGTLLLDEDDVNIRAAVASVTELLCPRAHAKNLELVTVVAPDVPQILRGDGVRLSQVLTNLIGNAVKFTEDGGICIDVGLSRANGAPKLRFAVHDTGIGVPMEKRGDIFKEFVQAHSGQALRNAGTGLGLAISKTLVEAMGGQIGLEAPVSGGSTFWFTLPLIGQRAAITERERPLGQFRISILTRNRVLREALTAEIVAAGGKMASLHELDAKDGRLGVALIDAGTDTEPNPSIRPDPSVRSVVLITPAMRARLPEFAAMGFASYLVKPIRQSSLFKQIRRDGALDLAADPPSHGSTSTVAPQRAAVRPSGLSILVVEDNPVNMLLIRELLRRRGHHVTEMTSGEAAIAAMQSGQFDLVLTDIHMPGMSGIDFTIAIRALEAQSGSQRTPIIALTADVLDSGRRACKEAGMDDFLGKPIDSDELDRMINSLLPKRDASPNIVAA